MSGTSLLIVLSVVGAILSLSWVLYLLFLVRPRIAAQRALWDALQDADDLFESYRCETPCSDAAGTCTPECPHFPRN